MTKESTTKESVTEEYVIENEIPLPLLRKGSHKYPFSKMEVGDSFIGSNEGIASAASAFSKKHPEYKFTVRKDGNRWRCWRIKVA